jgi:carbonic anhydrase/acetyltransferase-like protein (isoleucine patch superfamily)
MNNPDPPLCCKTADILVTEKGNISFGHGCIVHPRAKIIIEDNCSIIFGEYNIIEENVVIKVAPKFNQSLNNIETVTVYIGCYNHFKVGCYLENTAVENYNIFDYKCRLEDSYVESKSIITPGLIIPKKTTVKANQIVLDNQIMITNSNFDENDFMKYIKELYKLLAILLPKQNTMHNINKS